jgi:hypothetical protein
MDQPLSASEILSAGIYTVIYNGTNWILSGGGAGSGASAGGLLGRKYTNANR